MVGRVVTSATVRIDIYCMAGLASAQFNQVIVEGAYNGVCKERLLQRMSNTHCLKPIPCVGS